LMLPLVGTTAIEPEKKYVVRVRARLDVEALPSPLRPLAYLTAPWQLDSDWYQWPLRR
jgi:hypothetical protein